MAKVILENVVKRFGGIVAVDDLSLGIADGEFLVLVGPSGCGKSTTLRMIAGLEPVTSGRVRFDNEVVNNLAPKDRDIAMVFQSYALYPHMSVFDNMAFGLKLKGIGRAEIRRRVELAAKLLNIDELLRRKPRELSGGQRQRVAMGRAIVRQPKAFLFDEPLSNLDAALRAQMRLEIKKLHRKLATTIIYVTHDQIEAMTLADRIVIMNEGRIVQQGAPMEIYERPVSRFVAGFIGSPRINFLPGELAEERGRPLARLDGGPVMALPVDLESCRRLLGRRVEIGLRPEHIAVGRSVRREGEAASFEAEVEVVEPMGAAALVVASLGGNEVAVLCEPQDAPRPGERVTFTADTSRMHIVDPADGSIVQPSTATAADGGRDGAAAALGG